MKKILEVPKDRIITIYKEGHFDSAHFLENGYSGKCSNVHGHRWTYRVYVSAKTLDKIGMVIDFKVLKLAMVKEIEEYLDHNLINEKVDFNPTAENLAVYIFNVLSELINNENRTVSRVDVFESPDSCATIC
jgi:6-pyruvoyltetrahydropterin/6-carboxytetrahydropterin synthase